MSELFRNILNASVQGSIVIAVVLVLRLLLRRAPKKYICLLWILVGLRLLNPFSIESELSLQPRAETVTELQWQELRQYGQILPEDAEIDVPRNAMPAQTPAVPETKQETAEEKVRETVSADAAPGVEISREVNWATAAPLLWMVGAAAMLFYCVISYAVLKARLREAIRVGPEIWESDRIDTAFVLGYIRPGIYLPMNISGSYRELMVLHERCHLKRLDHWVKLLMFVALAVHWFNPLVWLAYVLLCRDTEYACDERVVADMDLKERKRYSAALLACCSKDSYLAVSPVAFGEKPIKRRIQAVLQYRKPALWTTVLAIGAVIAVAVCFLTDPASEVIIPDIPLQTYTASATQQRVTEKYNPDISFSGITTDTETECAIYHFDPAISEAERNGCVYYSDTIIARLGLAEKVKLVILADYDGAWTDGESVYLGAEDYDSVDFGAKLIANTLGGYVNYGAAYGYAAFAWEQEGWQQSRNPHLALTNSDARDLNWLCFREEFTSRQEIEANRDVAYVFVQDYIAAHGEDVMVELLRRSGDVSGVAVFNEALSVWYASKGLAYKPTEILYGTGGEYHDYLARCFYATFYMPKRWENRHFSALAVDSDFLHKSYADVKCYYETSAKQMEYIQQLFGVEEDTSDIIIEFLLSGTGGTWAARNQIMLNYHAYIPRCYLNMMLFRHTEIRLHGGTYYEWLYHGLGEYMGQMVPSLYEDEVLLYSKNHPNRAYSTLAGDWYKIWQICVEAETDPDVLWRTRWDLMAYYYGTDFNGEGCGYISFTAYLADQVGLQTLWDYFIVTENESPEIDFAKYRTEWEAYLEETYGQYPKFSEYEE